MNPLKFIDSIKSKEKIKIGSPFVEEVEANGFVSSAGQALVEAFHQKANPDKESYQILIQTFQLMGRNSRERVVHHRLNRKPD